MMLAVRHIIILPTITYLIFDDGSYRFTTPDSVKYSQYVQSHYLK